MVVPKLRSSCSRRKSSTRTTWYESWGSSRPSPSQAIEMTNYDGFELRFQEEHKAKAASQHIPEPESSALAADDDRRSSSPHLISAGGSKSNPRVVLSRC
ncbi:hypothetical protein CRG98_030912 [Punica granatum]|uniref:Uncharacterized protein n=1 Tax=Punica granatum TaxID=22663 RepID=A0A2I0IXN0_PUNGR|nr:hypothetical protein CRG98_030912 [Punica granatum]